MGNGDIFPGPILLVAGLVADQQHLYNTHCQSFNTRHHSTSLLTVKILMDCGHIFLITNY